MVARRGFLKAILLIILGLGSFTQSLAETLTYTYDSMNRLATVQYGNGARVVYTYDKMGNRLAMTVTQPLAVASVSPPSPVISGGGPAVQEISPSSISVTETAPTAPLPTPGPGSLMSAFPSPPGLQIYLDRLSLVSSVVDAEALKQEALAYLASSGLSPQDKTSYTEQFLQALEEKVVSLTRQAGTEETATTAKPASLEPAGSEGKDMQNTPAAPKNKILVDKEKIYTQPDGAAPDNDKNKSP